MLSLLLNQNIKDYIPSKWESEDENIALDIEYGIIRSEEHEEGSKFTGKLSIRDRSINESVVTGSVFNYYRCGDVVTFTFLYMSYSYVAMINIVDKRRMRLYYTKYTSDSDLLKDIENDQNSDDDSTNLNYYNLKRVDYKCCTIL
jgi:hypothetical protein